MKKMKKQSDCTREMSIAVVMKSLRAYFCSITFYLDLFPEIYYKSNSLSGSMYPDLIRNSGNDQVQIFKDWIENLIRHALNYGYLETCHLEVCKTKNNEIVQLVEVYKATVKYSDEGDEFIVSQGSRSEQFDLTNIGKSIEKSIRAMIFSVWNEVFDLEPLPKNRRMKMRLSYNDSTPEGYHPPSFREENDSDRTECGNLPVQIQLERLSTPRHTLSLSMSLDNASIESTASTNRNKKSVPLDAVDTADK